MHTVETSRGPQAVEDNGVGRVVLLVHGFPLHHGLWRHQIEFLSREFRVLAPDLRGFGNTAACGASVVSMANYADDLAALLEACEISEPVVFCGLSMGGYIAWPFARRHPRWLGHLILCNTKATADIPAAAEARRHMAERVTREGTAFVADAMLPKLLSPSTLAGLPEVATFVRESLIGRAQAAGIAAAQRGMAERPDYTHWLGNLRVPTLVVCGADDSLTRPAEMQALAADISGARYVEIPCAGHLSPLENPAAVNEALWAFLRGA